MSTLVYRVADWRNEGEARFVKSSWLNSYHKSTHRGSLPNDLYWPNYWAAITRIVGGEVERCPNCNTWLPYLHKFELDGTFLGQDKERRCCHLCGRRAHDRLVPEVVPPRDNVVVFVAEKRVTRVKKTNLVGWAVIERDLDCHGGLALHYTYVKDAPRGRGVMTSMLAHLDIMPSTPFTCTYRTWLGQQIFGAGRKFPNAQFSSALVRKPQ